MECLGIPIDHRLWRLIREFRPIVADVGDSDHIRILQEFGTSLKIGKSDYLTTDDLSFGIEMARPESKGGVVVVLLRPHSSQDNSDGFLAGKRNCRTVNAVSELVSVTSNGTLGFDDISVFDAIPFLDEKVTDTDLIEKAQGVFVDMIKAKQPEIVISCFKTETSNKIVQNLRSLKVGYSFEFDPQGSRQLAESGLSLTRVNAFHPSYAINFNQDFSCFKRLLALEFVKAFTLWRDNRINEEDWMAHLRHECHEQANKLCGGILVGDIDSRWKAHYLRGRWKDPFEALEAGFQECFFGQDGFSLAENCSYRLVESNITWICCDIAWILEDQKTHTLDISLQLHRQFKCWCQKSWPAIKLQRSSGGCNGYYDHSQLLLLKSKQQGARAKKLENIFYTFLRDLNLTYTRSQRQVIFNRDAQGGAFRRFAAAFESILEEAQERANSRVNLDLCDKINSLSLD